MFIIYYRNAEGTIYHYHDVQDKTRSELETLVGDYNRKNSKDGKNACIAEVEDTSLTAYLFHKSKERVRRNKDVLREAVDSIRCALRCVEEMEGQ